MGRTDKRFMIYSQNRNKNTLASHLALFPLPENLHQMTLTLSPERSKSSAALNLSSHHGAAPLRRSVENIIPAKSCRS
jgi:hypothetical protein